MFKLVVIGCLLLHFLQLYFIARIGASQHSKQFGDGRQPYLRIFLVPILTRVGFNKIITINRMISVFVNRCEFSFDDCSAGEFKVNQSIISMEIQVIRYSESKYLSPTKWFVSMRTVQFKNGRRYDFTRIYPIGGLQH